MNIRALLPALSSVFRPSLLVPHLIFSNFAQIPPNISEALGRKFRQDAGLWPPIRAILLDRDNSITVPGGLELYPPYNEKWVQLKGNSAKIFILSNTAGALDEHCNGQTHVLEQNLGVSVFRHKKKVTPSPTPDSVYRQKPQCHADVGSFLTQYLGISACETVVVGDRLFTDVLMGNKMGAWTIWIHEGISRDYNKFFLVETFIYQMLRYFKISPPKPGQKRQEKDRQTENLSADKTHS